jgi:hypothetical protein
LYIIVQYSNHKKKINSLKKKVTASNVDDWKAQACGYKFKELKIKIERIYGTLLEIESKIPIHGSRRRCFIRPFRVAFKFMYGNFPFRITVYRWEFN